MIIKVWRKQWPRVRETTIKGRRYFVVDVRRAGTNGTFKNFTDKQTALDFARSVGDKVVKSGLDSLTATDPRIKIWNEQAAVVGKTIDEVFAAGLNIFTTEQKISASPTMGELLNLWMLDKIENTLKPLRERSKKTIRAMSNRFKEEFGEERIAEMTDGRIDQYLRDETVSNQTKKNLRSYLVQFFNYALKKKYITDNPALSVEIHVQNGVPEYYTVEECQKIMKEMLIEENRCLIPYFALCLFGGVRPLECERMEWGTNVKLDTKEVYIHAAISKTKKDRLFCMSDNLAEWLEFAKDQKPLIPVNFRKLKEKALKNIKGMEWIADGLRHSFSTFHYQKHQNLEQLRKIMGNSAAVIEKFYKGTISKTEVEKFWAITPISLEQKPA